MSFNEQNIFYNLFFAKLKKIIDNLYYQYSFKKLKNYNNIFINL